MDDLVRRMPWGSPEERTATLLSREWLVTNGLGGYASGSISGALTRRFHGLLVAALPAPLGRVLMLAHMSEEVRLPDGRTLALGAEERPGVGPELHGERLLTEFRLEGGLPVWRFEIGPVVLEKRVVLPHLQNTVHVTYELLQADGRVRLRLRPSMHFRPHEGRVDAPIGDEDYRVVGYGRRFEVCGPANLPPLRLLVHGERSAFVLDGGRLRDYFYRVEASRGYDARGPLWSPGYMRAELDEGGSAMLVASTEPWDTIQALSPRVARAAEEERRRRLLDEAGVQGDALACQLVLAADQFIITPATRVADAARAHASGDDVRTVIAGYPWFTDWGRDSMISLEGLCLSTGRHAEAGWILRTFAHYVRDGLIPNLFPEHGTEGLYHTADATLWYFHAVSRYVAATGDERTLGTLLPTLVQIAEAHLRGTRFGIGVDPVDGLLRQGQDGYQLTWMDAKVDGWVVTPRRGKAVEINALWYNALRLLEGWLRAAGDEARAVDIGAHADRCRRSFNERFWSDRLGHLYDVVDGEGGQDPALRPNQLLAISLDHPVLDQARWGPVLDVCRRELLTPVGLRSLAPSHGDYKARYDGDLRSRDAAYHQGTVWAWLVGPYVDAYLRVFPEDRKGAREALEGMGEHLGDACLGTISEIFDAEAPYHARGCVAQAWSVAEVLRCWIATAPPAP